MAYELCEYCDTYLCPTVCGSKRFLHGPFFCCGSIVLFERFSMSLHYFDTSSEIYDMSLAPERLTITVIASLHPVSCPMSYM